jgi:hypothetical protein
MRHWWWLCLLPALCWAEPLKLAVPSLSVVDVDAQRASFLAEHLAQELSDEGAQVVSAQDLTVMLGLDRQRQLMGCTGGKCATELTSSLGVDCLVTGNVARVSGERYQLNLRMLDASNGQRLKTYTKRVVGFEPLLDEMSKAARILVVAGNKKFGRSSVPQRPAPGPSVAPPGIQETPAPTVEEPPPTVEQPVAGPAQPTVSRRPAAPRMDNPVRRWAWLPMAAGGVAMGTGVFFFLGSDAKFRELTDPLAMLKKDEAQRLHDSGKSQQNLARIGLSLGTTLLITGGAMALFSSPSEVEPQVSVGPHHVSLSFVGELPW